MRFMLKHKNTDVAKIELAGGSFHVIGMEVITKEHLPFGVEGNPKALREWWDMRVLPADRKEVRDAFINAGITSTDELALASNSLNLSDQYWTIPEGSDLLWEDVNFFTNPFSGDVEQVLKDYSSERGGSLTKTSALPDFSTGGQLYKKWSYRGGERVLVKGGSGALMEEPYNEVAANFFAEALGVPYIPYTLALEKERPYSECPCFVSGNTELVPAYFFDNAVSKANHTSRYEHYLHCMEAHELSDEKIDLDKMLALDFLISNTDRHYNNFGVMRDADTLEILSLAPIYDSGTSLGATYPNPEIVSSRYAASKTFNDRHSKQIKHITDFSWYDTAAVREATEKAIGVIAKNELTTEARKAKIAAILDDNIKSLEIIAARTEGRDKFYLRGKEEAVGLAPPIEIHSAPPPSAKTRDNER